MPIYLTSPGITIPSGDANALDLITSAYAQNVLSAGGVTVSSAQLAILPTLITAASREIVRFCGNRPFALTTYREIVTPEGTRQDRGEPATVKLSRFPVVSVTRCATNRTTALTVQNTSSANQETSAVFTATGDAELDNWVYTGLTLSRTASGTVTSNALTWTTTSPYTTIASLATSINALGGGWTATATTGSDPDLSLFPAAYLVGVREPKDAKSAALSLDVFATPYTSYDVERSTGILSCFGWGGGLGWGYGVGYGPGYGQLEMRYTAGFAEIPQPLQQVCAEVVQLMLGRVALDPTLKSESADKYSWAAKDSLGNLSDGSRGTLNLYKDWHC